MTSQTKSLDVAIVGGGIAGLMLAIGLLKHPQVKVTIYEAAHHFGEIGAGVAIGPNAARAMNFIDPRITEATKSIVTTNQWQSKRNVFFEVRNDDGKFIHTVAALDGQSSMYRADLLNEMVKLIPEEIARFGKRLDKMEDLGDAGVRLHFKDGSEAIHDCVVGCDGIKSETRHFLLGDSPTAHAHFSGKYCYRGLVPMDKATAAIGEELAANNQIYLSKHGHVLCIPVQQGKTMNVVAFASQESWDDPNWVVSTDKEHLLADFKSFGPTVQHIVQLMENMDIWALFDTYDHPAPTYYKGRVCVMGDAAHASTPHQGSGAGMAIEDAYVLSSLIGASDGPIGIEKAFKAYDAVRRERTQRLVSTSREMGHIWELEIEKYGGDWQKFIEDVDTRFLWIWKEDLKAEVAEGKKLMRE